ncbi:hypothetical protein GLYMA_02G296200v4 [Glycine max]|uniref:Zinc finger PHD-type domain-containing protein n=1 Tax=Glycine max TaxID=3847 RepID=I1JJF5_SOYBN|nr:protein ENHANCED DOWNY MILDEW 2 isoform X4 [Glycine max]KRH73838.1 hypothetical protein GLYMA_02G296200v4 [Glycine max]|eukprot:XP_006575696.1 protein ENHANCED DOWNY MILDEW 2 isoform X4 [Glycine max]
MKRSRSSSEDEAETEAEVQSLSVSNYHIVDDEDNPVSFAVLPIHWSDSENSEAANKGKVFIDGDTDNGLKKIFMQVTAWRFDLSNVRLEISLLSKDGRWIKLQKPRKGFQNKIRTVLITLHFLHRVKKKRQMSEISVWQDLSKDTELSSSGVKPSQKDLSDHVPLIREAAKRDSVLAKSKLLLMVLEKLNSQKLLDKEVNDLAQPGLTVVGIDSDMIDESNEESEERDDLDVCALCDNGGNVTCCDGVCMRSFHATVEAGRENSCVSLGFTQKEVDEIQSFYCKNCEYYQHQCFACGKLGSSDKVKGAEVIKCVSATCDRFYHPHCVAKLLPQLAKPVAEDLERNIADRVPFICPLHYCCVCKELENKVDPELQFAVCRRCPKSYHRKCLPREIAPSNRGNKNIIQRAWEGLLPNNRILIYCLNHKIDRELGTPVRDHIKFPNMEPTVQKINTTIEQKEPATKERVILKKKNVDLDNSSGKSIAKGSKLTGKLSSHKVGSKKTKKIISGSNISRKPKSKETSRCLTENKRSISKKSEMSDSEQNYNQPTIGEIYALQKEGLKRIKHDNKVNNVITNPLSVKPIESLSVELPPLDADSEKSLLTLFKEARSSITLESVLEKHTFASTHTHPLRNVVEKTITMGKLEYSVNAVQTALRKLESGCSIQDVKAFCDPDDLKQLFKWKIVDKLHWYVQNSDTIVDFCCGANDFSILMKKKLEENGKKCSYRNYDLLPTKNDFSFERRDWMTVQPTELPTGSQLIMGLNPPFGHKAALANKFVDKALEFKPKLVILIVPPETERLDKKQSPYDLIWEDENFLSGTSFYLPGSVDRQMDQRNARPPLLSLWSRPDWTTKHKVIAQENGHVCSQHEVLDTTDHTTDGNYAANLKSTDNQEDQASTSEGQKRILHYGNSQLNPIKGKSSGEGLKPKSDEVGDVVPGHGPSWGHSRNNNEQVVSETESSCKTNTPAIGQCEPCLGNLNHVMRSSLVSEPRTFSTSGSLGRSVPQSRYGGGGLLGFASGPNYAYASQHSCGWLEE